MEDHTNFLQNRKYVKQKCSEKNESHDWKIPIKATLGGLKGPRFLGLSICKVPDELRKPNNAYSPCVVSVGPLHHREPDPEECNEEPNNGTPGLEYMEAHKWRYMLSLLHRTRDPEKSLEDCLDAIAKLEENYVGSYEQESHAFDTEKLREIMLVDGCFILELFLRFSHRDVMDYGDQRIFHNGWIVREDIQQDLELLENQIPFFILQKLFDILVPYFHQRRTWSNITDLALYFFHPDMDSNSRSVEIRKKCCRHLLDLLHNFLLPTSPMMGQEGKETKGFDHCATTLLEKGVRFEKCRDGQLLDITYSNGVLKIPTLSINKTTETLLWNLIAFEQCDLGTTHHITSYAILMSSLIQSSSDVKLLKKKEIIQINYGEEKGVSNLFRDISRAVVLKEFYYGKLCKEVNAYELPCWPWDRQRDSCKARWRGYMNTFMREYCASPWKIIAFFVAFALLGFTVVQTYYTVRSYYPH